MILDKHNRYAPRYGALHDPARCPVCRAGTHQACMAAVEQLWNHTFQACFITLAIAAVAVTVYTLVS